MKKAIVLCIGLLISAGCYGGEVVTAKQREALIWVEKAKEADTSKLQIEYCNKALAMDPSSISAYNFRGVAYYNLSKFQQAIGDFNRTIKINPKNVTARYYRGDLPHLNLSHSLSVFLFPFFVESCRA